MAETSESTATDDKGTDDKQGADAAAEKEEKGNLSPEDIEKAVEAIYAYAGALLRAGKPRYEVEDALVAKGIERKTAVVVVDKLIAAPALTRSADERDKGFSDMVIGGLIALVGIVVTAVTYSAASGGGRYVIAWGAIVFGAIRFFKGLSKMGS